MPANREYQNIYGRRFGRGLRPWLLIPKLAFAGTFLGGLVSLLVLGLLQPSPITATDWVREAEMIRRAYARVIVPALVGAMLMGILLTLAHPGVFLRMRWLQVKLVLLFVFVPAFHLFMSSRSLALSDAVGREDFAAAALRREQLFRGTVATLAFALTVIILGRLKPRLGQAYGRRFSRKDEATATKDKS